MIYLSCNQLSQYLEDTLATVLSYILLFIYI